MPDRGSLGRLARLWCVFVLFGLVLDNNGQKGAVVDVDGVAWVDLRDWPQIHRSALRVAGERGCEFAGLGVVSEHCYGSVFCGAVYEAVVQQELVVGGCEDVPAAVEAYGLVGGAYARFGLGLGAGVAAFVSDCYARRERAIGIWRVRSPYLVLCVPFPNRPALGQV